MRNSTDGTGGLPDERLHIGDASSSSIHGRPSRRIRIHDSAAESTSDRTPAHRLRWRLWSLLQSRGRITHCPGIGGLPFDRRTACVPVQRVLAESVSRDGPAKSTIRGEGDRFHRVSRILRHLNGLMASPLTKATLSSARRSRAPFIGTDLDTSLRGLGVDTLLAVGFSFKSCLFQTLVNAFQHDYRVVFLRDGTDPPGTNEFPDTGTDLLPDRGWVRLVLTRLIEDHLGYSSTCKELVDMCERVGDSQ